MGSRLYTETKQEGTEFMRVGRGIFGLAKQQPSGIDAQVLRINQETREHLSLAVSQVLKLEKGFNIWPKPRQS